MSQPALIRLKSNVSIGKKQYNNQDSSKNSIVQQSHTPCQNSSDIIRFGNLNTNTHQYNQPNSAGIHRRLELVPIKQQLIDESDQFQSQIIKSNSNDQIRGGFLKIKLAQIVKRMVKYTPSRMYKNLTYLQLKMIDDKAYDSLEYLGQKSASMRKNKNDKRVFEQKGIIRSLIQKLDSFIPVLHPKHKLKTISDLASLFSVVYIFYILSITICFHLQIDDVVPSISIYISMGALFLNALITLNTGYQKLGNTYYDRTHIFYTYFKNNFFGDLLGFISILILLVLDKDSFDISHKNSDLYSSIKLAFFAPFLLKFKDFIQLIQKFEEKILFKQKMQHIMQIVRLFSLIILINHIMACIWIFNAKISTNLQSNWITSESADDESWFYQYIMSFYFCTVTMTSVGYGDIVAKNLSEYIIAIIIMLTSSGVFGFTLNQIGNIFTEFYQEDKEKKKKLNIINLHMEKKNVNHNLRTQIREYLEYVWQENNEKFANDSAAIVSQLNEDLKKELYLHQNKKIIDYLKQYFSNEFIQQAIVLIQEKQIKPHQNVQIEGRSEEQCLYLIEKGQVELSLSQKTQNSQQISNKPIQVLEEGEMFGISEFFCGESRKLNAKALGFVNLLRINRNDFIKALQDFPQDLEMFNYLKDRKIFNKDYAKIGETCISCGSQEHVLTNCNFIHFVPDRQKIITRLNYELPNNQKRKKSWKDDSRIEKQRRPLRCKMQVIKDDDSKYEEFTYNYYTTLEDYEQENLHYNFNFNFLTTIKQQTDDDEDDQQDNLQFNEKSNISLLAQSGNHAQVPPQSAMFPVSSNINNTPHAEHPYSNHTIHNNDNHRHSFYEKSPSINADIGAHTPPIFTANMNSNLNPNFDISPTNNRRKSLMQQLAPLIITSQPQNFPLIDMNMQEQRPSRQMYARNSKKLSASFNPNQNPSNFSGNNNTREINLYNLQQIQQNHQNRIQNGNQSKNSQDVNTTDSMDRQKSSVQDYQKQRSDRMNSQNSLKRSQSNQWQIQMRQFQKSIMQNIKAVVRASNAQSTITKTNFTEEQADMMAQQSIFQIFDKIKNYKTYFPHNNLSFILYNMTNKKQITQNQYLQLINQSGKSKNLITSYNSLMKTKLDLLGTGNKKDTALKKTFTLKHISFQSGLNHAPSFDNQSINKEAGTIQKNPSIQYNMTNNNNQVVINNKSPFTNKNNGNDGFNPSIFSDRQIQTARSPTNHIHSSQDFMPNKTNISLSESEQYPPRNLSLQSPNIQEEISENNMSQFKFFVHNFQIERNSDYFIKD